MPYDEVRTLLVRLGYCLNDNTALSLGDSKMQCAHRVPFPSSFFFSRGVLFISIRTYTLGSRPVDIFDLFRFS